MKIAGAALASPVALILLAFAVSVAAAETPLHETRALWAPESAIDTPEEVDALVARMAAANLNVFLPCVYCHGYVYFKNRFMEMPKGLKEGYDPLAYMLEKAHAAGIEVHPWFCVNYIGTAGAEGGGPILKAHPEFGARAPCDTDWEKPEGGVLLGNVQNKEYRDFLVGLMSEMVRDYPVDGLHYDYIRAGANSYDAESEKKFRERFGRPMAEAGYEDWVAWHGPAIDDIVRRTTESARKFRPGVVISAAVFTNVAYVMRQGQDAAKWVKNGWLDVVFTMDYEMSTFLVRFNETDFAARVKKKAHGVGLSLYMETAPKKHGSRPPALVLEQIQAVKKMGIRQFAFFASSYMDDAILKALAEGPFREKAVPYHRKKSKD
jgi:uncharacterized lipoprotein YddW (UPF0748 family)